MPCWEMIFAAHELACLAVRDRGEMVWRKLSPATSLFTKTNS